MKRITIAVILAIAALLLVAGIALSVSQSGRTVNGGNTFLFSGANGQATVTGAHTGQQEMQVRMLRNGAQVGGITSYQLASGANYNSTVTTTRSCPSGALATWVTQARLVINAGPFVSAWDSGPGRNLAC